MQVGKNLRSLRQKKGMTRKELSDRYTAKYGEPYTEDLIEGIETGRRLVFPCTLERFSVILGVSFDDLIKGDKMYENAMKGVEV